MIETGFFFFNTEAHPIDGACLECCRSLRSEKEESEFLPKLIDRYVDVKFGHYSFGDYNKRSDFKTLNQEYEELRQFMIKKEAQEQENYCKSKKEFQKLPEKASLTTLREIGHDYPFSCFLNDSFNIHINTYNSFSYFP